MLVSIQNEIAQGGRWFLVHTRPNCERRAEFNLVSQEFETFLPQVEKTIRHARRFTSVRRPLFPGYLFVRLDLNRDRWLPINGTIGVSRLLTLEGRPIPVPIGIVETLQAHSDAGLILLDRSLVEGQRVRVLSGPLANFTATVLRLDARRRIDILLEAMGAVVPVSIDRRVLAPAA